MPLPKTQPRPATYADVLAAPENSIAEILDGALHLAPRPAVRHAKPASRLAARLIGSFDDDGGDGGGPGGWTLLFEPELHLGSHVVVPDIAGWRRGQLTVGLDAPWIGIAPDWVCEVLSPSTAGRDRIVKMRIYLESGVDAVWLVDPDARAVEAYERDGAAWRRVGAAGDDEVVQLPPFEAVEIRLAGLWR